MIGPHFELIFVPKYQGNVIARLEKKLLNQNALKREVGGILEKEGITPKKIYLLKVDEGKGSKKIGDMFEGFRWRKYWGKVRGVRKGFLGDRNWKNDFYIYILYGDKKDGIMFTTGENSSPEIKNIGRGIYERILLSMQKHGPIPWDRITRIGTF